MQKPAIDEADPPLVRLGRLLDYYTKRAGLSGPRVEQATGGRVTQRSFSRWARGDIERGPGLLPFLELCKLIGKPLGELLVEAGLEEPPTPDTPGDIILDEARLRRILNTTDEAELRALIPWQDPYVVCYDVPRGSRRVDAPESRVVIQQITNHLSTHAPRVAADLEAVIDAMRIARGR